MHTWPRGPAAASRRAGANSEKKGGDCLPRSRTFQKTGAAAKVLGPPPVELASTADSACSPEAGASTPSPDRFTLASVAASFAMPARPTPCLLAPFHIAYHQKTEDTSHRCILIASIVVSQSPGQRSKIFVGPFSENVGPLSEEKVSSIAVSSYCVFPLRIKSEVRQYQWHKMQSGEPAAHAPHCTATACCPVAARRAAQASSAALAAA